MSVDANGRLTYGFVRDDETEELFDALVKKHDEKNEDEEEYSFEEIHSELQEKHHVQLYSVGYADVDIIAAYDACAGGKNFDSQPIPPEDLTQTEMYDQKIAAFLTALDIDPNQYKPGWHILGYMS